MSAEHPAAKTGWACGLYLCPHQPKCEFREPTDEQPAATLDVEARDIRKGDDLFGAGVVTSAVFVGESVQVAAGGATFTFWPDEEVTVRRV